MLEGNPSSGEVHPTALIHPGSRVDPTCSIGPFCIIGDGVALGPECRLISHVNLEGPTRIGKNNVFYPFCSIGSRTQDLKYSGEPTYLEIGDHNTFRESVTVNRATGVGEKTVIGSHNNFLAYSHVAHNCTVGNHCVFSNTGTLAGHVVMEDYAVIGGLSAVHQFCRIGQHALIGGCTKIVQDVPPFCIADGNPAAVRSLNHLGLQRRGFDDATIARLRKARKLLYSPDHNTSQACRKIEETFGDCPQVRHLLAFVRSSQRGIIR